MKMKHYKDAQNNVYGYPEDGSQDHLIGNKQPISIAEAQALSKVNNEAAREQFVAGLDYYRQRIYHYPEMGEFLDAWVKGDEAALEEYRQKCLEVKARFPKPEGF